ncbi:5-oxoprolinase subunit PxpA [Gracilibacillus kekensis]|uniref:5-oxoprolinase subunit A n=1 Tax=Gracilibacillus kekensis TaxID=1027249 RepID=A0A1M7N1U5_9BACI|nr:5-oxoprolinase subunit PxpA [Gracilibacillus kekensis]SHM97373.1 UPF0271 protein [Gracilibacillus kekensis]
MTRVILNCDLGESFGAYQIGNDEKIIPLVDAVNIACGFHAGDPETIHQTVKLAKQYNVKIGAHPGFQDLLGFGRRNIEMHPEAVYNLIIYQLGALHGFTKVQNVKMHHVKPHGALYNMASKDRKLSDAIVEAIADFDKNLTLVGLANSKLIDAGIDKGLNVLNEVFADRTYQKDGTLTPRTEPGAVIQETEDAIKQVESMVEHGMVTSPTGEEIVIKADTICVHGDTEQSLSLVTALNTLLKQSR